jgi:hypothetical protein
MTLEVVFEGQKFVFSLSQFIVELEGLVKEVATP